MNPDRVRERLASLQSEICRDFEQQDGGRFLEDAWERGGGAAGAAAASSAGSTMVGRGLTCVLENGALFERAGVALSDIAGSQMPPSATARNPHLAGRSFRAVGLSIVTHPRNPNAPLNGGPQMVEVSRDGQRVYFTNSLYSPWDMQFYPDGIRSWMVKLDAKPDGGLEIDPKFFLEFEHLRGHQVRLEGGDASSDSYCYS